MTVSRKRSIIYALIIALVANGFGWMATRAAMAHDLDHERMVLSLDPASHLGEHRVPSDGDSDPDADTHLSLHAAGCAQSVFLSEYTLAKFFAGAQVLTALVPVFISESLPYSPLRPPRNTFAS
ncbi:MAG: hypothetical protein ACKVQA_12150 [Burkholderiales bacterium]